MKTVTFDPAVYKLVTIDPTEEMCGIGAIKLPSLTDDGASSWADDFGMAYKESVMLVPDTLPGVVEHSGEPVAWAAFADNGNVRIWFARKESAPPDVIASYGELAPIFTHPPAQPDTAKAIHYPECWDVAAYPTLESALSEIGAFKCSECHPEQRNSSELYEFLRSMQHGEMTVSRGLELIDIWLAGNYRDDMLPPVGAQPDTEALQVRIAELEAQLAAQAGQQPTAWRAHRVGKGKNPQMSYEGPVLCQSLKIADQWRQERIDFDGYADAWIEPLYAAPPAPANVTAIVQAALEAAAEQCKDLYSYRDTYTAGLMCSRTAYQCSKAIRAIDPQTIIDAASVK